MICESVIRLANKTSVSTEINRPRIFHASALVPVCESRVDRGQRGFSALALADFTDNDFEENYAPHLQDDVVFYLFLQKQNLGAKLHIYL